MVGEKHSTHACIDIVNPLWYQPVAGPKPTVENPQWGESGGPQYYRGKLTWPKAKLKTIIIALFFVLVPIYSFSITSHTTMYIKNTYRTRIVAALVCEILLAVRRPNAVCLGVG